MSISAAQASAFYREVAEHHVVWTMQDDQGIPVLKIGTGQDVIGLWSLESRVQKVIKSVPKYSGFVPVQIGWEDFLEGLAKRVRKEGVLVGINWSGKSMRGYDISVDDLITNVTAQPGFQNKPRTWWARLFGRSELS